MLPILTFLLKYAYFMGSNPYIRNVFSNTLSTINLILIAILFLANIYDVLFFWDGAKSVEKISFTMVLICTFGKILWWRVKKNQIKGLISVINDMWPVDKFGLEHFTFLKKKHDIVFKMYLIYVIGFYVADVLVFFHSIFKRKLMIPGYYGCDMEGELCFYSLSFMELFVTFYCCIGGQCVFDGFFLYLVTLTYLNVQQMKLSFNVWTNLTKTSKDYKEVDAYLGDIVIQHTKMLNLVEIMKKLYAEMFLVQILGAVCSLFSSIFMLTYKGFPPSFEDMIVYPFLYACDSIEIGITCTGGTIICDQMLSIADEAYKTEWYNQPSKQSKAIALILMKAQIPQSVTALGLININLNTFTAIITNSFKICALIKTVTGLEN